jgi:hypothetical protein
MLGGPDQSIAADTVVLAMLRTSEDTLFHQLKAHGLAVRRIVDCVAPREVYDAALEGFREAHSIFSCETPVPSVKRRLVDHKCPLRAAHESRNRLHSIA